MGWSALEAQKKKSKEEESALAARREEEPAWLAHGSQTRATLAAQRGRKTSVEGAWSAHAGHAGVGGLRLERRRRKHMEECFALEAQRLKSSAKEQNKESRWKREEQGNLA